MPTSAEAGLPGFELSTWYGVFAPAGTPSALVARMTREIRTALQTPAIKAIWEKNGSDVPEVSGAEFSRLVSSEVARWRKVVGDAGIRLE